MNIAILGGAGFLGAHVTASLMHKHPDALITIVDPLLRSNALQRLNAACHQIAKRPFTGVLIPKRHQDLEARHFVPIKPDTIFHLAEVAAPGMPDAVAAHENMLFDGVKQYLTGINRTCRLIIGSSASVYGNPFTGDGVMRENMAGFPSDCYGFSKWMLECEAQRAAKAGIHTVVLRFFNLYGPGDQAKQAMASHLTHIGAMLLAGEKPKYFEAGDQVRDFLDVREAAWATVAAAAWNPGVYNIGSGVGLAMLDVIRAAIEVIPGGEAMSEPLPPSLRRVFQRQSIADISAAIKAGWQPLRVGMHAVCDHFRWMLAEFKEDPTTFNFLTAGAARPGRGK